MYDPTAKERPGRRAAVVEISLEYLSTLLMMPDDTIITSVDADLNRGMLRLVVADPNLPLVHEGDMIPSITPVISERSRVANWGDLGTVTTP